MKKKITRIISVSTVLILLSSFFILPVSATSYASTINVDTYLPAPPTNDNQKCLAIHYKNGGYYLLVYGHDGNENVSEVFQISNSGNKLYVNNNSTRVVYCYIYFINLETCDIGTVKYFSVPSSSYNHVTYSESYVIDSIYPYGLTTQLLSPHSVNYSLQVNWSTRTDNNIATIRNEVADINNKSQQILNYLASIDSDTSSIRDRLIYTNTYLGSIDGKISTALTKMDTLINLLQQLTNVQPSEKFTTDKIKEQESAENAVDDELSSLKEKTSGDGLTFDMNGEAIPWIYQQLEDIVKGNSKVFAVFLSILSMSLIMFVLNKGANA